ncbi:MAG: AAA family ATPase, partial [Bacillota bacterium]
MKSLYITGTAGSGKTAVAAGLAQKFTQQGYRVTYLKPVGYSASLTQRQDKDALLMQKLLKMDVPLEIITPVMAGPSYLSGQSRPAELLDKIKKAYESVAEKADIVIIGGAPRPHVLSSVGLDTVKLAELFGAAV